MTIWTKRRISRSRISWPRLLVCKTTRTNNLFLILKSTTTISTSTCDSLKATGPILIHTSIRDRVKKLKALHSRSHHQVYSRNRVRSTSRPGLNSTRDNKKFLTSQLARLRMSCHLMRICTVNHCSMCWRKQIRKSWRKAKLPIRNHNLSSTDPIEEEEPS